MSREIKPVIFSGMMVRGLRADRKTVTRRLATSPLAKSNVGDLLYVRENWRAEAAFDGVKPLEMPWIEIDNLPIWYEADGKPTLRSPKGNPWSRSRRPAIHLPRHKSRLTLLVADNKAQRLHDMTDEDAIAEGVYRNGSAWCVDPYMSHIWSKDSPLGAFRLLWNELHGVGAWQENPAIVALTFGVYKLNVDAELPL
jgi:hypothetical protein